MDLLEAFFDKDVWENVILKGVDKSVSRNLLKLYSRPEVRVALLEEIVRGEYHIKPPHIVQIPKDNGEFREIFVNSPKDRLILAGVNQAYYKLFGDRISSCCKAYQEGLSCGKTVREVAQQELSGYKLDLSKYFDTVSKEHLNKCLAELDTGSPLDKVIQEYYNDDRVVVGNKFTERYKSLAQGSAVSAFLSNYVLRDVDFLMMGMCDYYCRYCDDMILLGSETQTDKALAMLRTELDKLGLRLNPDKVERISPDKEFRFLGFGVRGPVITISQKDLKRKKAEIGRVCRKIARDPSLSRDKKLHSAISRVKRIFFNCADPCYGWLYAKAVYLTALDRVRELDEYAKEHIRAAVTGKWNFTSNINKVPEDSLRLAGYVSLVQMAKLAQIDRDAFLQEHLLRVEQNAGKL